MASTVENFFEKKANRDQEPLIICGRTVPTWESEASTARNIVELGSG